MKHKRIVSKETDNAWLVLDHETPAERTTWPDPCTDFAAEAAHACHWGGELTKDQRYFLSSVFRAYAQLVSTPSSAKALPKMRKAQGYSESCVLDERTQSEEG